jgi:dienelactone hydrolase
MLRSAGFGTLLFDLLTQSEEKIDATTAKYRFDIKLLSKRLTSVTDWITSNSDTQKYEIGYFGASTGAAASLISAAERQNVVRAVVSRGGRPDLARDVLISVKAPTLLIVGENDPQVIELNRDAYNRLNVDKDLVIVPRATHLFEESGALEQVGHLAINWFSKYLKPRK